MREEKKKKITEEEVLYITQSQYVTLLTFGGYNTVQRIPTKKIDHVIYVVGNPKTLDLYFLYNLWPQIFVNKPDLIFY